MKLSAIFEAVASKHLVACDLPNRRSHQHELTGVSALRSVLGTAAKTQERLVWAFFPSGTAPVQEENGITFYDARAKSASKTRRSEWRLYYHGNFLTQAEVGDLLILAKTPSHGLVGMIFPKDSPAYKEAVSLFDLGITASFDSVPVQHLENHDWNERRTPILARWLKTRSPHNGASDS